MLLSDSKQAWIGASANVERVLNQIHADLDENRRFVLDIPGQNMAFLHSAREVLITDDMSYFMQGARMSLYALMRDTEPSKPVIEYGEDE